jgi:hypothetical protein
MVSANETLQEIMRRDLDAHKRAKPLWQVTKEMLKRNEHYLMELHENYTS